MTHNDRSSRMLAGEIGWATANRFRLIIYGLGLIAVVLRSWAYGTNPSLSLDEARLGLNVIERSFSSLLNQLDFNQAAPPAFLETMKAATSLFGSTELALRALPFVAALLAVPLFWHMAAELFEERTALVIGLALFSASTPLIVYGSTAKQYSSDVLVGLVLSTAGLRALRRASALDVILVGALGITLVWFSHPAVFILAGIMLVIAGSAVFEPSRRSLLVPVAVTSLGLVACFTAWYLAARTPLEHLRHSLESSSTTLQSPSVGESVTFLESAAGSFRYLVGIDELAVVGVDIGKFIAIIFLILCILGLARMCRRALAESLLLAMPLMATLIAIALGIYPHFPRVSLFAVPALVVFAAEGMGTLIRAPRRLREAIPCWAVVCLCLVFTIPAGVRAGLAPSEREALRPVMRHLAMVEQPGDGLYLYHSLQYAWGYYLACECFAQDRVAARGERLWPLRPVRGAGDWDPALRALSDEIVVGRRLGGSGTDQLPDFARIPRRAAVWVVLGDITALERDSLLQCLDSRGTRSRELSGGHDSAAARAYLYKFALTVGSAETSAACR